MCLRQFVRWGDVVHLQVDVGERGDGRWLLLQHLRLLVLDLPGNGFVLLQLLGQSSAAHADIVGAVDLIHGGFGAGAAN